MNNPIDVKRIVLFTTENGFYSVFCENKAKAITLLQAYEMTEQEYEALFLRRKYSSYDSFRVVYSRKNLV